MSIICECVTDVRNRLVLRWCLVLVSGVWCLVSCQLKLNYGLKRKWRTRTFKRLGLRGFGCNIARALCPYMSCLGGEV